MKYKEVEFKYRANDITLQKFNEFCNGKPYKKFVLASGWDNFYSNSKDTNGFYRHRTGPDMNQLTYKCKKNDTNNVIRDEQNVDLERRVNSSDIEAFLARLKYKYNTSVFKTCFVYSYDTYTLVFYVVWDTNMHELDRFIEIEMSEEHSWASEQEAYSELVIIEKLCKDLGINPKTRVKKSLFELFAKEK